MQKEYNQPVIHKLIADAARALALVDLIIEGNDPETSALAFRRGSEAYDDLVKRGKCIRLSEADQAVFYGMTDRLRARLRSLCVAGGRYRTS